MAKSQKCDKNGGEIVESRNDLRGLIYSKFKSISELASSLGWTRQKATNIVNGVSEPSLSDTDELAKALGINLEEAASFFLR